MKFNFAIAAAVGFGALMGLNQARSAELLDFGTTYTITGMGFTGTGPSTANFTDTVTLGPNARTFDHGTLKITEHTTFVGFVGDREYAEFCISTNRRDRQLRPPPLVANGNTSNVTFGIKLSGIRLKAPAITSPYDAGYFNFATNGVANAGITTSSVFGILGVETDPNPGSIGAGKDVFYCPGCATNSVAMVTGFNEAQYPFYKSVTFLHIDPNTNGYFFGLELTASTLSPARGLGLSPLVRSRRCEL